MLYIHIPYCRKKCLYCDFFSGGLRIADWESYVKAILFELFERSDELPQVIDSIYIGGGTPSLMPDRLMAKFMDEMMGYLINSGHIIAENVEITIEVNPEDVNRNKIECWKDVYINRISLGIQTFSNELLSAMGRNHDAETAQKALELLSLNFNNINGDLIFGLPNQSMEDVTKDLSTLLGYSPKHVSVYNLMYEEGTALNSLKNQGRIKETDELTVISQYELITETLQKNGFDHYEISNYAQYGYRSKHNSGYWEGKPYLGLGPSAHSYDGNKIRRANPADLFGYIKRFSNHAQTKFYNEEMLDKKKLLEEKIMLSLRTSKGIDLNKISLEFGSSSLESLLKSARSHLIKGNLNEENGYLKISPKGLMIADIIIVDLLP